MSRGFRSISAALVLSVVWEGGCGSPEEELLPPFSVDRCAAAVDLKDHAQYLAAVAEAAQRSMRPAYIDAIVAQNPNVVWEGTPGSSRILVSTCTTRASRSSRGSPPRAAAGTTSTAMPWRVSRC